MSRKFDANWVQVDAPDAPAGAGVAAPSVGLECPTCGCRHFETVETRPRPGIILRRKQCRHCGHRVTTRERVLSAK
jgi:DNA-directed RNA polymerase subunit RPC12/RpoP